MKTENRPHVIIIGAGFAGLWAVKAFHNKNVRVTLIDKNNYHTFLPLLYQVGAAEIEPEEIAFPVRTIIRKYRNTGFLRAGVSEINLNGNYAVCNNDKIYYDYCILTTGTAVNYITSEWTAPVTSHSASSRLTAR